MIKFDSTKNHDYLDVPTMKRLIESGVDTSDSRYYLYKIGGIWYLGLKEDKELLGTNIHEYPTYSAAKLLINCMKDGFGCALIKDKS